MAFELCTRWIEAIISLKQFHLIAFEIFVAHDYSIARCEQNPIKRQQVIYAHIKCFSFGLHWIGVWHLKQWAPVREEANISLVCMQSAAVEPSVTKFGILDKAGCCGLLKTLSLFCLFLIFFFRFTVIQGFFFIEHLPFPSWEVSFSSEHHFFMFFVVLFSLRHVHLCLAPAGNSLSGCNGFCSTLNGVERRG